MFGRVFKRLVQEQRARMVKRSKHQHSGPIQMDIVQKRKALLLFKDKAEVTVFDRQTTSMLFKWAPWVVGGQMLMWINFADFYWRYSMDKNDDTGELSLSPAWKRACISAVALVAGVSIGGGILHFISRSVARMQVIDGGKMVKLETYRMSGRGLKSRVVPIGDMFSRDRLFTGEGPLGVSRGKSPQYSIYANRSSSYAYIMSRSGWFMNPKLFDVLFHRAVVSGD